MLRYHEELRLRRQLTGAQLTLKPSAIYNRYKDWCTENGYKYEGAQNFYKRLSLAYLIIKRRPWKQETTGNMNPTNLVDNVTWETGEEPETSFVPED